MVGSWESMTIDELFALREQMQEVLTAKLKAKKIDLERRSKQLSRRLETLRPNVSGLVVAAGHFGLAWQLLPFVSGL
jgi:hypothetical protein